MPASFQPSQYQQAIFDVAASGTAQHLVVKAAAGSGKSTTLLELLERYHHQLPSGASVLITAFNTSVVKEFAAKIKQRRLRQKFAAHKISVECSTINSVGYRSLQTKNLDRDSKKYTALCEEYYQQTGLKTTFTNQLQLRKVVQFARRALTQPREADLRELVEHYDLGFLPKDPAVRWSHMWPGVRYVLERSQEAYAHTGIVDFIDQVWLPNALAFLERPQFDIILVDEAQDLNRAQLELLLRCAKPDGRMIFVGDEHQAMYGFNGADTESLQNIIARTQATVLPLSICYRCPASHVALAQQLVPEITAAPWAEPGMLKVIPNSRFLTQAQPGDLVLCRTNAPLVEHCLALLRQGIPAVVLGRDVASFLLEILQRLSQDVPGAFRKLGQILETYRKEQLRILSTMPESHMQVANLNDTVDTLQALYRSYLEREEAGTLEGYETYIKGFFVENTQGAVTLATVHKAKGSEYDTVYIIRPGLMPHPAAKLEWQYQQEINIEYVALTRAKKAVYLVDGIMNNLELPKGTDERVTRIETPASSRFGMLVDTFTGEVWEEHPDTFAEEAREPRERGDERAGLSLVSSEETVSKKRGRPRKGNEKRAGIEITLDVTTLAILNSLTENKSGYIEELILQQQESGPEDEHLQRLLTQRSQRFPPQVAKKLLEIQQAHGVRAAYEASEAIVLFVDPQRSWIK